MRRMIRLLLHTKLLLIIHLRRGLVIRLTLLYKPLLRLLTLYYLSLLILRLLRGLIILLGV